MNHRDNYREERGSDKNAQKKSMHRATEMELLYQRAQGGDAQATKELQQRMDEDAERFRKEHKGQ